MKKAIIIDGNSIAYAAQNSRPLTTGAGEPVQAIYGALRTVKQILSGETGAKIVVLWDSPRDWRSAEYPEYKGERENTEELKTMRAELKAQRPKIVRALYYLGIDQLSAEGFEADDLAWVLGSRFEKAGMTVEYRTGDMDWIQLVTNSATWIDPIKERVVNAENFSEFTGVSNWHAYVQLKALKGDKSDNLDGIPGIGEKTALELINYFGSVPRLFSHHAKHGDFEAKMIDNATLNRARKKINTFCNDETLREAYFFNMRMMDLRNAPKPKRDQLKITKGKFSEAKFKAFCEDHQFKSILNRMSDWIQTFEG